MIESKGRKNERFGCLLCMFVSGMPLPTRPQRYCDPASLVQLYPISTMTSRTISAVASNIRRESGFTHLFTRSFASVHTVRCARLNFKPQGEVAGAGFYSPWHRPFATKPIRPRLFNGEVRGCAFAMGRCAGAPLLDTGSETF